LSRAGSVEPRPTRALKRLGQHFLAPAWADKVVAAIAPAAGDAFLEIGPGTGALTVPLAASGSPILAVEVDRRLAADLAHGAPSNVTVLTGDILRTDVIPFLSGLGSTSGPADATSRRRFRVVGNLPYYIASPILFRLIELHQQHGFFADAVVMLQKEVADRLLARPGTKEYGVLTILLARHAQVTRLLDLPPGAFSPPPKVRSTVVRLVFGASPVKVADEAGFERLVKMLFSQRRKTLSNAIKSVGPAAVQALAQSGLDGRRRPETLQVEEAARLADLVAAASRPPVL
jgi:16S rRNA (adenine1518-N6/adenine1519-N6)-dimethyltransferase